MNSQRDQKQYMESKNQLKRALEASDVELAPIKLRKEIAASKLKVQCDRFARRNLLVAMTNRYLS